MKKLFTILFIAVISANASAQMPCQAYFTYSYNPVSTTVNLYDASYNWDSTQINVTSWTWTAQYNGAVYTYTGQNPVIPLNGFTGYIPVCLTITTTYFLQTCQSTWCDTIILNNNPPLDTCIAAFIYQDNPTHQVQFIDQSTTTNGTINSWAWTVSQNGMQLFASGLQNPVFTFQPNVTYSVCLFIATDSGCLAHNCQNIMVQDSNTFPCLLTVTSFINPVSVINGNDGFIDLTVTGGTPPYSYQWNTGATSQDIFNLASGVYTVAISTIPACPNYTYSFYVGNPLDTSNIIIDTLYSPIIDTCLNFLIDSFYLAGITIQGNTVTVQWIFTGGGATATLYATYTFTSFGTQAIILSISCGSKTITNYTSIIYISQILGVAETSEANQINLYPNPVSDFLNITFSNQTANSSSLKIFNTAGQQVYSSSVAAKTSQLGINVSGLPSGVYFVQIDTSNGKPMIKKFLK